MEMVTAFCCGSGNTRRWGEASRRDAGRSTALFFVQHGTFPQVHLLETESADMLPVGFIKEVWPMGKTGLRRKVYQLLNTYSVLGTVVS